MDNIFLQNPYFFEYFGLVLLLVLLFGSTFLFKEAARLRDFLGILLIAAPIIYFYLILNAHILNIPLTDDYSLLETIHKFRNTSGFISSLEILFEQVNQHRFAFERIVMLIMVFFTGTVNIKFQIILGNLFMLGILYFLFLTVKKEKISWYYFIPIPYVLFNLVYYENAFWGIAALQNTPLIFFGFLSAYGISRGDKNGLILGITAALVTTFVSGSGLLTWIIGTVILAFQKRYKILIPWLLSAVSIFVFYFLFDYSYITARGDKVWVHPVYNAVFLFGFWGNAFYLDIPHPLIPGFHADMVWCVLLGMAIGVVFLIWVIKVFVNKNLQWSDWFLAGAFMFVMGTGAMFVMSRPISNYMMNGGSVFSRRYMIFGVVLLATAYVGLVILTKRYKQLSLPVLILGFTVFLTLNFLSYHTSIVQVRKQYEDLSLDAFYWKNYKTFLTAGEKFSDIPFWNHPTRMRDLVNTLDSTGLSEFYVSDKLPRHLQLIGHTGDRSLKYHGDLDVGLEYRKDINNIPSKYLTFRSTEDRGIKPAYFILSSKDYAILLPAIPVANSWSNFLKDRTYYDNTFQYALYREKLPAGKFEIWVMTEGKSVPENLESKFTREKVVLH